MSIQELYIFCIMFQYPDANIPFKSCYEETKFLGSLNISLADIEPKAENCTKVKYNVRPALKILF